MFYRHVNLLVAVVAVMTHASAVLAQLGMGGGVSGNPQPFNAQFAAQCLESDDYWGHGLDMLEKNDDEEVLMKAVIAALRKDAQKPHGKVTKRVESLVSRLAQIDHPQVAQAFKMNAISNNRDLAALAKTVLNGKPNADKPLDVADKEPAADAATKNDLPADPLWPPASSSPVEPGDYSNLKELTLRMARELAKLQVGCLILDGVEALSPDVAAALARCRAEGLHLNGLTNLSFQAATALATMGKKASLQFGVVQLTPDVAWALARCPTRSLKFTRLMDISQKEIEALTLPLHYRYESLSLPALSRFSPGVAVRLARCSVWDGSLPRLTSLTPRDAIALGKCKAGCLTLTGLTMLEPEVAAGLATVRGVLNLDGLLTLTPTVAEQLARKQTGSLELNGITTLVPQAAEALAKSRIPRLSLNGLTELDPESAEALTDCLTTSLGLAGLKTLTPRVAAALARCAAWDGHLPNVTALETPEAVAIAQALVRKKGPISLSGLMKIPADALAVLQQKNLYLPLRNQSTGNTNVGKANEKILIREINAPHDGWRGGGYADGHVEVIKPE